MRRRPALAALPLALVLASAPPAARADGPPRLRSGAVELGIAASLVSSGVAGRVSQVALRTALLRAAGAGLAGLGAEIGYRHVGNFGDFDDVRATGHLSWQAPLGRSSAYPFAAVWGGVDHERVGSFGQTRWLLGPAVGVRALVSSRAGIRIEYRYARVHDPDVSDFGEHELLTGVTLFLRNGP